MLKVFFAFNHTTQVIVAEGSHKSLRGVVKEHLADFVHGSDGFGNTNQPAPAGTKSDLSAAEYTVKIVNEYPGQITYLALASLTNLSLAFHLDPELPNKLVCAVSLKTEASCRKLYIC